MAQEPGMNLKSENDILSSEQSLSGLVLQTTPTDIQFQSVNKSPSSSYPCARKPPPPPPHRSKAPSPQSHSHLSHSKDDLDVKQQEDANNQRTMKQHRKNLSHSAINLFASAKSSISRGAKSVSSATSDRLSLDGQLRQARISLEKYISPKVGVTSIPQWVLKGAKGIVFVSVVKVGALIAVSGGTGCVIIRRADGSWSGPSSIGVAGLAAGFLAGASKVDYIMILPNDRAVAQFTGKGQLRLGADIQLAVGPVLCQCAFCCVFNFISFLR